MAVSQVVKAVIKIGRKRRVEASIMALSKAKPRSRSWLANSTIKIPFLVTMPINMIMPIWL